MVDKVLKALLILTPLAYCPGLTLYKVDYRLFMLGAMALFTASLFDTRKRDVDISLPAAGYLGVMASSLVWTGFTPEITTSLMSAFYAIVVIWVITGYASEPKTFYPWIGAAAWINLAVFFLQRFGYNPIFAGLPAGQEGGMMGNAPQLLMYLSLALFMAPSIPLGLAVIVAAFLTGELAVFIMAAGVAAYWLIQDEIKDTDNANANTRYQAWILWVIVCGTGAVVFRAHIAESLALRWNLWRQAIELICRGPLFGRGVGMLSAISPELMTPKNYQIDYLFNSPLQFLLGAGAAAAAWMVYACRRYIPLMDTSKETRVLLALALLALVEYPLEIPRLWITILAALSFFLMKCSIQEVRS